MTYSQKYCLVHFVQPIDIGTKFSMSNWPVHVTLADVFAIDRDSTNIDAKLRELLIVQPSITVTALQKAMLGTTDVVLIKKVKGLLNLHESIINLLQTNGAVFNTPEFTHGGFLPHSTIQSSGRLHEGDEVKIDSITLIDMFPNEDWQQRKVLGTFKLQEV